jgi:aminocarboxymuconate-semialdehyde decarboxylase
VANERPKAVDVHAHVLVPEIYEQTSRWSVFAQSTSSRNLSDEAREKAKERSDSVIARMADADERIKAMDAMGVDVQVLSASLVHQCTYEAEPQAALALDQQSNDRIATMAAKHPLRLRGIGSVPLQSPALAVQELGRCMKNLGLSGVTISTRVRDLEIGERSLRPFWEKAEELGAVVFIHPAGNPGARFRKHFLWNSIGQNFEEAMAIASLMYEGILDAYPKLKICVSHGGGYMPFYMGRIARNYIEKPTTRINMSKAPNEYLRMLYYDTCVYDPVTLQALVAAVGAERVLLGSDYPVGEMKPVEFIEQTPGLTATDKGKIIGGNAARLFGLA